MPLRVLEKSLHHLIDMVVLRLVLCFLVGADGPGPYPGGFMSAIASFATGRDYGTPQILRWIDLGFCIAMWDESRQIDYPLDVFLPFDWMELDGKDVLSAYDHNSVVNLNPVGKEYAQYCEAIETIKASIEA
jgi:hypothetical protein